ncbi:hypothetical protein ACIPY3_12280 [Paenarthrobacter sp. NPDC089714]|uniref:hypothetical protein n=1 Tax=Paenarthrobacter sp. NPDC089714 TaxID=3364377 RepID=UPI0038306084
MNEERAVALSDASERLVYAYVSGSPKAIAAAEADLRHARESSAGSPSPAVLSRLIKNDPVNAAISGLITLPELQEIVVSDLDSYLSPEEASAVAANPANLRGVLAARINQADFSESKDKPLLNKKDFALAARGVFSGARVVSQVFVVLNESIKKVKLESVKHVKRLG